MFGLEISLTSFLRNSTFSPANLFALSEPGLWLDPSDLSTLFQDTAGLVPVTTPGQSVAMVLDKSKQSVFRSKVNRLLYTDQFDNALWAKFLTTVTANTTVAPDGSITADSLFESASSGVHYINQNVTLTAGKTYSFSVYIKANGRTDGRVYVISNTGPFPEFGAIFDLAKGTVTNNGSTSFSITPAGNGFYRICVTGTTINAGSHTCRIILRNGPNESYAGNASLGVIVWGAQLEEASACSAYQAIVASMPVEWVGNHATQAVAASRPTYQVDGNGRGYLYFDGVDDFMVTPSIDFSGTDEMTMFAGLRKLSDAARGMVFELGNNSPTAAFQLNAPPTSLVGYQFTSFGSLQTNALASGVAPDTLILTGQAKISTDTAILRKNGVQTGSSVADQGTGNYSNAPLNIGMRGGTLHPFNGYLYSLIVRGKETIPTDLNKAEDFVSKRTGVTL